MVARGKLTVYWDAQCPFCGAIAERLARYDTHRRLRLVDYHDPLAAAAAQPRFTASDLDSAMHAQLPDGTWRVGYFAVAAILKELPSLRWLGWLLERWFLADVGPRVYAWFAAHRIIVSKALRLPPPCEAGGSCRISPAPALAKAQ